MAKQMDSISSSIKAFIAAQKMFFVATADTDGRVNLSPKGLDSFKVLDKNRVIWLNLTGSGNETAAHLQGVNRMTIMFCSFEKQPLILRLYGTAQCYHKADDEFEKLSHHFPTFSGSRQIFDVNVEMVQTSCGFAVPFYEFVSERDTLTKWSNAKSGEEMSDYWKEKNMETIDGKPTGMKVS
ncbi:MAG: pyridoxamine 5'-phosphate oxidase family protein [Saprospiraceae bacterium]